MQFDRLSKRLEGISDASKKGYQIRNLYRLMYLPEIWQEAYANIYSNKGAMTPGVNENTLDGMSHQRINRIITALKKNKYHFTPVKRTYIPKRSGSGKKRPLGLPTGDDKLVQEVARLILERIYEPIFSDYSHGFRRNRSCHTALKQVKEIFAGVKWFIEIDISGFFDNMDHRILVSLLEEKIADRRFIKLINGMLKAGYLEDWKYHQTYSGTPQGGIVSPILSNIYLHELDKYAATLIGEFRVGKRRPENPEYRRLKNKRHYLRKRISILGQKPELMEQFHLIGKMMRQLPSVVTHTDEYKRLKYCRYADDFILGVTGTKEDAKQIMQKVVTFLQDSLNLQISDEKSGISYAKKGIQFLSYDIHTWRADKVLKTRIRGSYTKFRTVNEHIRLRVPPEKVMQFCQRYGYGDWSQTRPRPRPAYLRASDVEIVAGYNAELRGLVNYYCIADDAKKKLSKLEYLAHYSLVHTLADKHRTKMTSILKKLRNGSNLIYRYKENGRVKALKVFSLKDMTETPKTWLTDEIPNHLWFTFPKSELLKRMNANTCEYCGRPDIPAEVHHVRKLKDLHGKSNLQKWQKVMIARNRKTMILCVECHRLLHAGKLPDSRFSSDYI